MTTNSKPEEKQPLPLNSPIDALTIRLIRVGATIALLCAMAFFIYSAYVGTFLDGGSTQVFTGVACLLLVLISCMLVEKIILEKATQETTRLDVK